MSIFTDPPKKERGTKPIMPPAALEACERLREKIRWRAGSDKQLDDAVRRSIEAYAAFQERMYTAELDEECRRFLEWAAPELDRDPVDFVVGWFAREWKRVEGWAAWGGDLKPFVFSTRTDRFDAFGHDLAVEYGDGGVWTRFLDSIKGGKK